MKIYKSTLYLLSFTAFTLTSCRTALIFRASESDANIYVDGKKMGSGETQIVKVRRDNCVHVKIEKTGFITEETNYCYETHNFEPLVKYVDLPKDDAYDASIITDYANKDFEVRVNDDFDERTAWKVISQIVMNYFDNLEMTDMATGYMKTSWQSKSFSHKTVRSRVIVKQSSSEPLKYKIKIISEYTAEREVSVKQDDKFREWDRVLRAYEDLVTEFQTRLSEK